MYDFFKTEGVAGSFSGSFHELELMLSQLELDCMALGKGCVLSKIFSCGKSNFQIRIEFISLLDDDFILANESSDNGSIIQPKNEIHKIKRHSGFLMRLLQG